MVICIGEFFRVHERDSIIAHVYSIDMIADIVLLTFTSGALLVCNNITQLSHLARRSNQHLKS